jgi:hypothetical protein
MRLYRKLNPIKHKGMPSHVVCFEKQIDGKVCTTYPRLINPTDLKTEVDNANKAFEKLFKKKI